MRRSSVLRASSVVLTLCACTATELRPTVSPPLPVEPPPARSVAAPDEPEPTAWHERYVRRCMGSLTLPILSFDQRSVVLCDARFALREGRFEGEAPLGVLAVLGDAAITDDYSDGGLSIRSLGDGSLLHHAPGGRPELVVVSADGAIVASLERDGHGQTLRTLKLPTLEPLATAALTDAGRSLAVSPTADGGALWYGERGCRSESDACPHAPKSTCSRRVCDPPRGWRLETDGRVHPWDAVPPGLDALAFDPTGQWVLAVDPQGRRWVQPTRDASGRLEIPGRATMPEWPGMVLALAPDATVAALGDAHGLELWRRNGAGVARIASLPHGGLSSLAITHDAQTLLLGWDRDLRVLSAGPAPARGDAPGYDHPAPAGWERATSIDGRIAWPDEGGTLSPPELGIIAWYRNDDGADFRVVLSDRAELGRPELSAEAWTALALDRIDAWTWIDGRIDVPHTLQHWTTDEGRAFELHYTTVGGCEQYEVTRRVEEHGDWLVRYELQMFAGVRWREAWDAFVHQPLGAPPQPAP